MWTKSWPRAGRLRPSRLNCERSRRLVNFQPRPQKPRKSSWPLCPPAQSRRDESRSSCTTGGRACTSVPCRQPRSRVSRVQYTRLPRHVAHTRRSISGGLTIGPLRSRLGCRGALSSWVSLDSPLKQLEAPTSPSEAVVSGCERVWGSKKRRGDGSQLPRDCRYQACE